MAEAAAAAWAGFEQAAAPPQTPRSGSPRGRASETKSSGSPDAAGGRSVGQRRAGQAGVHASAEPGWTPRPQGGKMPRVVPEQRSKLENEEFFRRLSREWEIKSTRFRERPHEERQPSFQNACRDGRSEIISRRPR